jgi:hypothetical protein
MAQFRILFADDQIPPQNIEKEDIIKEMQKIPKQDNNWYENCLSMREAVEVLSSSDNEVDVARKIDEFRTLIRNREYDLAIIDLDWWEKNDELGKPNSFGFTLCDELEKMDALKKRRTPVIINSMRFPIAPQISDDAVLRGFIPAYKFYTPESHQALRSVVNFTKQVASDPKSIKRKVIIGSYRTNEAIFQDSFNEKRKWANITYGLALITISLSTIGAACLLFGLIEEGKVIAIIGISSTILTVFSRYIKNSEKKLNKSASEMKKSIDMILEKME